MFLLFRYIKNKNLIVLVIQVMRQAQILTSIIVFSGIFAKNPKKDIQNIQHNPEKDKASI